MRRPIEWMYAPEQIAVYATALGISYKDASTKVQQQKDTMRQFRLKHKKESKPKPLYK